MSQQDLLGSDTVKDAILTKIQANLTELYNLLSGVASPTLLTPTIASLVNALHTHANNAGGGPLTNAVLGGTITGTYTLGGTPTISNPTVTTPTIASFVNANHNHQNAAGGGTLSASYVVEAWTTVSSFGSGWTGYSVGYLKDPMGFVHLKGAMTFSSGSVTAFTLASGYRPIQTLSILCATKSGAPILLYIGTDGAVQVDVSSGGSYIYLDGITFKAA